MRTKVICTGALEMLLLTFALARAAAFAQETDKPQIPQKPAEEQKKAEEEPKTTSATAEPALGMSIVGNHEAPKALVLVPWKPSEPGKTPEISTKVDASLSPIDKEVF